MYKLEEENFNEKNTMRVVRPIAIHQISETILTKFQKWICKVFKIEPSLHYSYSGFIKVDDASGLDIGCVVVTENGLAYTVTSVIYEKNTIRIKSVSLNSSANHGFIENSMLIIRYPALKEISNPK